MVYSVDQYLFQHFPSSVLCYVTQVNIHCMNRYVVTEGKFCIQLDILYIIGVLPYPIPKLQILHN